MSNYLKPNIYSNPPSLSDIEECAMRIKANYRQGVLGVIVSSLIILFPLFGYYVIEVPFSYSILTLFGLIGFILLPISLMSLILNTSYYYSPVDKETCVEILALAKKYPSIKEYCLKVSEQGRQILFFEFYAMCDFDANFEAESACKELYAMTAERNFDCSSGQ